MRTDALAFDLPEELIAQEPATRRGDARLLHVERASGEARHHRIADLGSRLRAGDLLVLNDTRVLPARVLARRETGGHVEVLFLEPVMDDVWTCLLRSSKTPYTGEVLSVGGERALRIVERSARGGTWRIETLAQSPTALMAAHGRMPLPPYIRREEDDERDPLDRDRYQTVFAREAGAVAAPTAGLHLDEALLDALRQRGVATAFVTLHVGLGTFAPVRSADLDQHAMHEEAFRVPSGVVQAVRACRDGNGRVVAVGTTVVRALESAAKKGDLEASSGRTNLLIQPGYDFRVVDALLTNFHLPGSTLLALVAAFLGLERTLAVYQQAVRERYRFYSYGDAMLIT